jgi:hypothetical protein
MTLKHRRVGQPGSYIKADRHFALLDHLPLLECSVIE